MDDEDETTYATVPLYISHELDSYQNFDNEYKY